MRRLDTVTDFFVVCTADVDQHARAIVRNIEDRVRETTGDRVLHREGMEALNWILLDYVDVVVHVFKPSFREFYKIEDLWGDAEPLPAKKPVPVRPRKARRVAESSTPGEKTVKIRIRKTADEKKSAGTPARSKKKPAPAAPSPKARKRTKK